MQQREEPVTNRTLNLHLGSLANFFD